MPKRSHIDRFRPPRQAPSRAAGSECTAIRTVPQSRYSGRNARCRRPDGRGQNEPRGRCGRRSRMTSLLTSLQPDAQTSDARPPVAGRCEGNRRSGLASSLLGDRASAPPARGGRSVDGATSRRARQGGGHPRSAPAPARGGSFCPRPSGRRHRAFRPRIRLCGNWFRDRWCILTPPPETAPDAVAENRSDVGALWHWRVVTMTADHHDKVLAMTSHLPHLIAYTIVGTATKSGGEPQIRGHRVLGQRVSRLHPHRRLGSGDVARHLPQQPRSGARDRAALHRRPDCLAARHPLGEGDKLQELFTRTRPSGARSSRRSRALTAALFGLAETR